MLIDRLSQDSPPLPTAAQVSASPSSSAQIPSFIPTADKPRNDDPQVADQVLFSDQNGGKIGGIAAQNERQNEAAAAIRARDRVAEELGQKIDGLKKPLETIVKNFPPFSPEDKERLELLRSYSSLRKEIDELTFPPPPDVVRQRAEIALPAPLPMSADDSQIADHVDKLDAAAAAVASFRSSAAADTAAFLHDGRFYSIFSEKKSSEIAKVDSHLSETTAAQKSAEVGRQFADSPAQGVTAAYPQFLKGLS